MKTKSFISVLFIVFILAACTSSIIPVPTKTSVSLQTITPVPPTLTPTLWITPKVTATPRNIALSKKGEINSLIKQLHLGICPGSNLAIETPPPVDVPPPSKLEFTEIRTLPNPKSYYVSEIADNIDNSRQALIACEPDNCVDNVYVKDNKTGKAYKVYFGTMTWRPLQWLTWVNKDTFIVAQSSNPHYGLFVAINFDKQAYEYYGMASECLQSTPTP